MTNRAARAIKWAVLFSFAMQDVPSCLDMGEQKAV
jgi:hypothetical protein